MSVKTPATSEPPNSATPVIINLQGTRAACAYRSISNNLWSTTLIQIVNSGWIRKPPTGIVRITPEVNVVCPILLEHHNVRLVVVRIVAKRIEDNDLLFSITIKICKDYILLLVLDLGSAGKILEGINLSRSLGSAIFITRSCPKSQQDRYKKAKEQAANQQRCLL